MSIFAILMSTLPVAAFIVACVIAKQEEANQVKRDW